MACNALYFCVLQKMSGVKHHNYLVINDLCFYFNI
jgi:hypothetical protein